MSGWLTVVPVLAVAGIASAGEAPKEGKYCSRSTGTYKLK